MTKEENIKNEGQVNNKVCVRCLIEKQITDFSIQKRVHMSGRIKKTVASYCKECVSKYYKKRSKRLKISRQMGNS